MTEPRKLEFRIRVVVEPDGDEFHAYCPALKGLHTSGKTELEAVANARDAAEAYLKSLLIHGDPIPVGCFAAEEHPPKLRLRHTSEHIEDLAFSPV